MNIWAVSSGRRDSSGMPAKEVRCLTWDCPRNSWTVAGMGSGLSMRARAEITGRAPGRCAKASKVRTRGGCWTMSARSQAGAGRARASAWWRRPSARRAAGGRSPGAGPASTPDGRSEDPPAGVGRRRRAVRYGVVGVSRTVIFGGLRLRVCGKPTRLRGHHNIVSQKYNQTPAE